MVNQLNITNKLLYPSITSNTISFNPNGISGISLSGFTNNILIMRSSNTLNIIHSTMPTISPI